MLQPASLQHNLPAPEKETAKADDLKKIEGAGPKAAEALVNAGVDTFAKLAK